MKYLIERLEKTTGADRQLDADVHVAVVGGRVPVILDHYPPHYTHSVDAAVTAVPEGWAWFVEWIGGQFSEGDARVWVPSQRTQGLPAENFDVRAAANPAIALCIAALKARVALNVQEGT